MISGEQKPAIRVQIDPAKLSASGLTLEDIRGSLAVATTDAAKGTLNGAKTSFTIAANDQLTRPDEYDNVIVAYKNGAPLRVRDVGQAVEGPENDQIAAWANNKRSILLVVSKEPGANVIETVDQIKARVAEPYSGNSTVDKSETLLDRTETIRASVADVEFTLALTIGLVVLIVLLFLRNIWATLIPSVTVPLALLGSAALMYLAGFSLDNLSLMALTIAVGFVLDDAVVVVENIYRHVEAGLRPYEAATAWGARDWFHGPFDQRLADRGLHSASPDERHCRAAVSRIRAHGHRGDRRLGARVADAYPDDGVTLHETRSDPPRPTLSCR